MKTPIGRKELRVMLESIISKIKRNDKQNRRAYNHTWNKWTEYIDLPFCHATLTRIERYIMLVTKPTGKNIEVLFDSLADHNFQIIVGYIHQASDEYMRRQDRRLMSHE